VLRRKKKKKTNILRDIAAMSTEEEGVTKVAAFP
jgi:hypothetical protein